MPVSFENQPVLNSNVARIRRPFVASEPVSDVKENVAHKVRRYTSRTLFPASLAFFASVCENTTPDRCPTLKILPLPLIPSLDRGGKIV